MPEAIPLTPFKYFSAKVPATDWAELYNWVACWMLLARAKSSFVANDLVYRLFWLLWALGFR